MTATLGSPDCDGVPGTPKVGGQLTSVIDLASRWLGGSVLAASDESFGDKDNLLNPGPATYQGGRLGNRGEIVERLGNTTSAPTRVRLGNRKARRAGEDHDYSGGHQLFHRELPGVLSRRGMWSGGLPRAARAGRAAGWVEVVPQSPLEGDRVNVFPVCDSRRFTHVRLSIFPDGGVARLRVSGQVLPDPRQFDGVTIDLASQAVGGALVSCSDDFYTSPSLLIRPDEARTMGDGWEARRRRGPGNDFAIFQLGLEGDIRKVVVETIYFRYNASGEIAVQRCGQLPAPSPQSDAWEPLVERTIVQPDTNHVFMVSSRASTACVRLDAFPDGGLSRFRLIGWVDPAARRRAGTTGSIRCRPTRPRTV